MTKTIAIFGAGTGLGSSVAHRFGREGYNVALIGRRVEPLEALVTELGSVGIDARAFRADLSQIGALAGLIADITAHFGSIDVLEYAPISNLRFHAAKDLTVADLRDYAALYLFAPVELVQAVLPQMLERGDGAILIGHGYSAVEGAPFMSGVGPIMAAARNYIYSLHGELAPLGIYAGTLTVTAMIDRSAGHAAATIGEFAIALPEGVVLPVVDPDDLAEQYWNLFTARDRAEQIHPAA